MSELMMGLGLRGEYLCHCALRAGRNCAESDRVDENSALRIHLEHSILR